MEDEKWLKLKKNEYIPSILQKKEWEEVVIYVGDCVHRILEQKKEFYKIKTKENLEYDLEKTEKWYTKNMIILKIENLWYIKGLIGLKWYDIVLEQFNTFLNKNLFELTWWKWNIYKINDDEFIFYDTIKESNLTFDEENYLLDPLNFINKIEQFIKSFYTNIDWQKIYIDFSLGAKIYDDDKDSDIIKDTYKALDEVQYQNNTKSIIFTEWLNKRRNKENNEKIKWIKKIRRAFKEEQDKNNFDIFLQWIYNEETKKIEKYETLSRYRWVDEFWIEKYISPFFYMKHIESLDYTSKLMNNNVKKLLDFIDNNNLKNIDFSLNCYASDILDLKNFNLLNELLEKYKIPHNNIIIEILEHWDLSNLDNEKKFIENIKILKEKWFKIAIDDFWTWHSNFIRLLQIEPHFIKIDGSFIKEIANNNNNQKIVNSILLLSNLYNSEIIVEFVSNEEDYLYLKWLGIKLFQWYFFHEPSKL